jgi:hypothetical protein
VSLTLPPATSRWSLLWLPALFVFCAISALTAFVFAGAVGAWIEMADQREALTDWARKTWGDGCDGF